MIVPYLYGSAKPNYIREIPHLSLYAGPKVATIYDFITL